MSIAEKSLLLKQDFDEVYEAGKSAGGGAEQNPLEYANLVSEMFKGVTFPTGYEITLDVPKIKSLSGAFYNANGLKKVTLKGNENGNTVNFYQAFRSCASLETLDLTKFTAKPADLGMGFYYALNLVEILGEIDLTECTKVNNAFQSCGQLVTITPKANSIKLSISFASSSKLSDISTQSIIDGLADLTGGTAQTLDFNSTTLDSLTDEQLLQAANKNWEVV